MQVCDTYQPYATVRWDSCILRSDLAETESFRPMIQGCGADSLLHVNNTMCPKPFCNTRIRLPKSGLVQEPDPPVWVPKGGNSFLQSIASDACQTVRCKSRARASYYTLTYALSSQQRGQNVRIEQNHRYSPRITRLYPRHPFGRIIWACL